MTKNDKCVTALLFLVRLMRGGLLTKMPSGAILVLLGAAMLSALTAGSLSVPVDEVTPDADAESADVIIQILDNPPSYSDSNTLLPVSVALSGQTVRWEWEGGLHHSATSDSGLSVGSEGFDSGVRQLDGNGDPATFEKTFTEPGVYKVSCQIHQDQHGLLVVV